MANKKRGESNADRVQRFFKEHPERTHRVGNIASSTGLRMDQVRGAISYLNAKAKAGNAIAIECVERGVRWRYTAPVEPPKVRKRKTLHERLDAAERTGMQGVAQAARELDAKGHEDRPITEAERRAKATRSALAGHQVVADQNGGIAEAARKSALGSLNIRTDRPATSDDFSRLKAELGNMHFTPVITLKKVGETPEGYAIGKDEDTGGVFKVVPL